MYDSRIDIITELYIIRLRKRQNDSGNAAEGKITMKYLALIKNVRTSRYDGLYVFTPILPGTVIGWGSDEQSPDGIAYWTVTSCDPCP